MSGWAYVPAFTSLLVPPAQTVVSDGILVGYNAADRDAAIIMSFNAGPGKIAYYHTGLEEPNSIGIILAFSRENYEAAGGDGSAFYCSYFYDDEWHDTFSQSMRLFYQEYGDLVYSASTVVVSQVIASQVKPYIPFYTSIDEALEAMDDGSWEVPEPDAPVYTNTDPYYPGGTTSTTTAVGGDGTFTLTSDPVDFPELPTLSASNTGFITIFNPTLAQVLALSSYMWSDAFDVDSFRKIFANPMDCILGLSIVPVAVPDGSTQEVKVGNISTGVSMTRAASQYVEVDCGSITVNNFWGGYLDYSPYTRAEIYLPYCGTHPLNIDEIMGKTVHVKYHVDILSGACVCYVKCGESVLYSFQGQCSSSIPISGNDFTNTIRGALTIAASAGALVASGGLSAPVTVGGAMQAGASTATNVMNMKPNVEKSGAISGMGGQLALQIPYLIFTAPRQALPKNQNRYTGYPSYSTVKLSAITGYTEVYDIRLQSIPATDAEKTEILSLLKGGVIL